MGDLVDRGPVSYLVQTGRAFCVPGNHDMKLVSALRGRRFGVMQASVHTDKPHTWHMKVIGRLCAADTEVLLATPFQVVDLEDEQSSANAGAWWAEMIAHGGQGMVVKPLNFIAEGRRGITQPAIKFRGPEYLLPANLERLRARNVGAKRSLASREFALGIEALERFVRKEPLRLSMSASSEFWRWKASRLTLDCSCS